MFQGVDKHPFKARTTTLKNMELCATWNRLERISKYRRGNCAVTSSNVSVPNKYSDVISVHFALVRMRVVKVSTTPPSPRWENKTPCQKKRHFWEPMSLKIHHTFTNFELWWPNRRNGNETFRSNIIQGNGFSPLHFDCF